MYCTNCGHPNPEDANFCANCGQSMRALADSTTGSLQLDDTVTRRVDGDDSPEIADIVAELDDGTALLVAEDGSSRFLLDGDVVTVGRHPSSDIFLDDITVSRRHAEFRRSSGRYWLHDVGSLNGTYINGTRAEDQMLQSFDEVQVGKFKLTAHLAGETK